MTALVEWPVALAGSFEARFLALPREVLISTLQDHQRYFPVEDAAGSLLPAFIAVSNIESRDPHKVRDGNERVVRPRLADAAFFFAQDRKQPLAARLPALDAVTFQAKLGSLGDKTRRIMALAADIAVAHRRAGGRHAAGRATVQVRSADRHGGRVPGAAGHHGPLLRARGRGAGARWPAPSASTTCRAPPAMRCRPRAPVLRSPSPTSSIRSPASSPSARSPTGNKDPFGLRRAALGVQRILIEKGLELDLKRLIDLRGRGACAPTSSACGSRPPPGAAPKAHVGADVVAGWIYDFLMERLRAYYLERGSAAPGRVAVTTEMFDAVLAARPASPLDFDARLKALSAFLDLPEAASLTAANKRIANILRKAAPVAADRDQRRAAARARRGAPL